MFNDFDVKKVLVPALLFVGGVCVGMYIKRPASDNIQSIAEKYEEKDKKDKKNKKNKKKAKDKFAEKLYEQFRKQDKKDKGDDK